ncbi:MAG: glycosyltransferase family 4 protein [Gammaproteobacteria bacterium]|nr:glycosyltransferase family 4 protein [Gammaproteobacteria bacterium]
MRPAPQPEVAFCLFKYFPYGGLQRNFIRTALRLQTLGYRVRVYTLSWEGRVPDRMDVVIVPAKGVSNHRRYDRFAAKVMQLLHEQQVVCVVGFNKMAGLDVYYAADPCFEEKALQQRDNWYRRMPRYRLLAAAERAVFERGGGTRIMLIAPGQQQVFERHYGTEPERFTLLPPGIARDRMAPVDAAEVRAGLRTEFGIADTTWLLLMVGSGFITKGLDRALIALAQLPPQLRERCQFIAVGQDNPRSHLRMAQRLGVGDRFRILPGRDDIPRFLQGADVLLHPAYAETAGNVLLEAVVAGLPVIVTDVCGNAPYVERARAGRVIPSPFQQLVFNEMLGEMLRDDGARADWRRNGIEFGRTADIYSLPEHAARYISHVAEEGRR